MKVIDEKVYIFNENEIKIIVRALKSRRLDDIDRCHQFRYCEKLRERYQIEKHKIENLLIELGENEDE